MAKKKQIPVFDLEGDKARRSTFLSFMKSKSPGLVFLNGHGNDICVTGHNDESVLDEAVDMSVFSNSILYARSCDSAKVLGNILVQCGALAYIGYTRKFIVGTIRSKTTKPLEDQLAKLFLEPSNLIPTTILKGHTTGEADKRSKQEMVKNFQKMISSEGSFEERFAARWLWSNIRSQVVIGDQDALLNT